MVSIKFKILFTRKGSTVTMGFFGYWWYAVKPYFVFFVTPSVRSLSLHRSFSMLLPLLLVPLTFISNLLLGGITILSESLMTDSAQGPHVSTFWKICVDKTLWRDNSKIILDFQAQAREGGTQDTCKFSLNPHPMSTHLHKLYPCKKSSGDMGIFVFIWKGTC